MSFNELIITWLTNPGVMMVLIVVILYVLSRVIDKEVAEEIKLPTLEHKQLTPMHPSPEQEEIVHPNVAEEDNENTESDIQVNEQANQEDLANEIDVDSLSLQDRLMYVSHKKQQEDLSNKEREMAEKEEAFDIKQQKDDLEREKERHELEKQKDAIFNESQDAEMERRRAEQKLKEANFRNKQADAKEREAKRKLDAYNNGRYW